MYSTVWLGSVYRYTHPSFATLFPVIGAKTQVTANAGKDFFSCLRGFKNFGDLSESSGSRFLISQSALKEPK